MSHRITRQRLQSSASSGIIAALLLCASTQALASAPDATFSAKSPTPAAPPSPVDTSHFWDALALTPQDAWSQLRKSFAWQDLPLSSHAQARVDKWIQYYRSSPENIATITQRATLWLAWITRQVKARHLPGEIALIPFIESSFDPRARSHRGAAGLWQFMPGTGDALGLVRNTRYDGRLDVVRSTEAALDYIEMQADQWYEGDIALSLAAYNAGAGTVNRAVRHARRHGKQGEYWDLHLPSETMQYVPKLHAIAAIINDPKRYDVRLPDIQPDPGFTAVSLTRAVSLHEAAQYLNVAHSTLAALNPGLINGTVHPDSVSTLLVPAATDSTRVTALAQGNGRTTQQASPDTYRVARGDNLSTIAARYNLNPHDLIRWNALERPDTLKPGQLLTLSES